MLFGESDDEEVQWILSSENLVHLLMAIKFLICMSHVDFMNSVRCQYLVIVEIICTVNTCTVTMSC